MRFEDWVNELSGTDKNLVIQIIEHNNKVSGCHNGMMILSSLNAFHDSRYHYTVETFDAHCGSLGDIADYPLGAYRWTVSKEICKMRYEASLNQKL
jgi:hypothetical protein